MDLFLIDVGITYRVRYLTGFHHLDALCHGLLVLFCRFLRHIADHGCDALRNGFGRNNDDIFVLSHGFCLICCEDDIFVVRQNKDILCIDLLNCSQHILGARVHGLTALDQVINTESLEDLFDSLSDGHGDESVLLRRLFCCFFSLLIFLCLLCCDLFCVLDQALLMLLTHVVDLHSGQLSVRQRLGNCFSRIVGMYVYLNQLVVCNENDRISDSVQKIFECINLFIRKRVFQHNDKLGAVAEFDFFFCLFGRSDKFCLCFRHLEIQINLFPEERVICALQYG